MKVSINPDACVGQGMCVLYAPEVFVLGDDDGLAQVLIAQVPEALHDMARKAAHACPEQAITISE